MNIQSKSSIGHMPEGQWTFDESVTAVFDDMLARSIPAYHSMREACAGLAASMLEDGASVLDLGCSRGEGIADLLASKHTLKATGIDSSQSMVDASTERFADDIATGRISIMKMDLRTEFPFQGAPYDLILCILTLQFVPIEYRHTIMEAIWQSCRPGGAIIFVEKVLGSGPTVNRLLVRSYHDLKERHGYSRLEIDRKREALEGSLVPLTERANLDLMRCVGFREIECFWRYYNFSGWLALK